MIERRRIVEAWQRGKAVVLVTLVRVEGSSYRNPGARLLINADGTYVGSVSGGCLEAEIVRKAQWLVRNGAVTELYSTLFDDTADIPYGLGCGGTVQVLLEPADTPEFNALMTALAASLQGQERSVSTWVPSSGQRFARQIASSDGEILFATPAHTHIGDAYEPFVERIQPPQRVFVFGAGDDAQPMVRLAALLGWSVYIFDSRAQWARPERFPEAERVLSVSSLDSLRPGTRDAVILMTHSFEQDRAWLQQVLPCRPGYLGLLGSRHRSALLVSEAAQALGWDIERACNRLFSPVGLDLGGDGPESIALSTIAEIQAFTQGKLGHSRRMTLEAVQEQIAQGGSSRYLQVQCAL